MASLKDTQITTYIGPKGYSIYKEYMDTEEQKSLKQELTVSPFLPKSPVQPPAFPIYRESNAKLYIVL
jgi:hypothetical protein